jgi:GxxExxY protein
MEEYKHSELTGKIIRCAIQVHSFLGCGFQEIIYQRALAIELTRAGLKFQKELDVLIFYKDVIEPIGTRRLDFLVEELVLVELKALDELDDLHISQVLNYLKICNVEIGLLLNFGEQKLKTKRLILSINGK